MEGVDGVDGVGRVDGKGTGRRMGGSGRCISALALCATGLPGALTRLSVMSSKSIQI